MEIGNEMGNQLGITTSNQDIIHVYKKNKNVRSGMVSEERSVCPR